MTERETPAARPVVVDCDPGLDDVVALAVLAGDVAAGRIRIEGFMAVAGNVGRDRCAANARLALDRLGMTTLAVALGADRPLGGLDVVDAGGFHGGDGLAGLAAEFDAPDAPFLVTGDPGRALADLISGAAGDDTVDVLTLGPLTDLALAIDTDPGLTDVIGRVVSMGGGFGTVPPGASAASARGNTTALAEFNIHADPIAADRVFAAGLDLTLVPLDVTRRVLLDDDDADAVEACGGDQLVVRLLRAGIERQRSQTELDGMAAHDPLAALVLTDPGVVTLERRSVAVAVTGDERGACVEATDGRPPIAVALDVDVTAARAGLLARMGVR